MHTQTFASKLALIQKTEEHLQHQLHIAECEDNQVLVEHFNSMLIVMMDQFEVTLQEARKRAAETDTPQLIEIEEYEVDELDAEDSGIEAGVYHVFNFAMPDGTFHETEPMIIVHE
ncbi:MAG: hypothetical protein ACRCWQ_02925 [Bacilli bacterium]